MFEYKLPPHYRLKVVCKMHPAFVTCSTNAGGGLVKLITCSDVPGHSVDVSRNATSPENCSALLIATTNHAETEVQKAESQLYRMNMPLLHRSTQCPGMSLHVISFTKPSTTLVHLLQVTNAGVRRPGYEAKAK